MEKRWLFLGCVLVLAAAAFSDPRALEGRSERLVALELALLAPAERGAAQLAFGDWGALRSDAGHAVPWKLQVAALALQESAGDLDRFNLATTLQSFGFLSPGSIANWPEGLPEPDLTVPLGHVLGLAQGRLLPTATTLGTQGCAACHAGVTYRADGSPDLSRAWLGMPNTSINVEAFRQAASRALSAFAGDGRLMETVLRLFPDTTLAERLTLQHLVLPELRAKLDEPGARTGLGYAVRLPEAQSRFASIPDLGGRLWRRTLLSSGSLSVPGEDHTAPLDTVTAEHRAALAGMIAYLTVPRLGVPPLAALDARAAASDVTEWMAGYAPQRFPGEIRGELLQEGQTLYARHCADCHGSYDASLTAPQLVTFPNWEGSVGTDPQHARLFTQDRADAINSGPFGPHISARVLSGYAAPPLTGLWASAPYLHNGSVPTLWHLMHPAERPKRFEVGGHHLDFDRVGIAGVADGPIWRQAYPPWSAPRAVDTTAPGLSNAGHDTQFAPLNAAEKTALLEYLKLL